MTLQNYQEFGYWALFLYLKKTLVKSRQLIRFFEKVLLKFFLANSTFGVN